MKAAHPLRRYGKALNLLSIMLIVWSVWLHAIVNLGGNDHYLTSVAYAETALDNQSLIKNVEVAQQEKDSLVKYSLGYPCRGSFNSGSESFRGFHRRS